MNLDDYDGLTEEEAIKVAENILEVCKIEDELENEKQELSKESSPSEENELQEEFKNLLIKYKENYKKALFEFCFKKNIFFSSKIYKMIESSGTSSLEKMPQIYIDTVKADVNINNKTFFDQIMMENFEKIYNEKSYSESLSEEDRKNRQVVIEVFSYDPFAGEPDIDKPQLYRDLAGMSNEAMRKDVAKQKAAISIVRSYGNIEKYQRKVAEITSSGAIDDETQKTLDNYLTLISKIQTNINQTAEKNNFTVKGIGSNGKGMLSDVMEQIDERGIDEGIVNYYDIETSKSIEEIANISMRAQLNQISLSKTDYVDILNEQCNIVRKSQRIAKDAEEALRLAKCKIKKQELIEELEEDYRKKGISEEEIKDFISREYTLYSGDDAL